MNKLLSERALFAFTLISFALPLMLSGSGCGRQGGVVGETDEYSYEEVAAQIRAEDEASEAERELRDQ
ncbi:MULTISPECIES: hypothetical protein [Pirellulaceae]|uniref:Uncharacterized protein n=1 Tax=Aporhodopirellula rubra TaxID=980271 RepID=A0A7W5DVM2_9BACT|nr:MULTISPECIES: hypothetical protein [Pirellulaceae]EMI42670.1 secreted protein [Rhodopirellula sp. SWK7]MBB3204497.1 hypothetical protein [Aporhodopirellula rubra]